MKKKGLFYSKNVRAVNFDISELVFPPVCFSPTTFWYVGIHSLFCLQCDHRLSKYASFKVSLPGFFPGSVVPAEKQILQGPWAGLQLSAKPLPKGQWRVLLIQFLHELRRKWTCDWLSGFPVICYGICLHVVS